MRHAGLWWAPWHGDVAEPTQSCVTQSCVVWPISELSAVSSVVLRVCGGVGAGHLPHAGRHQNARQNRRSRHRLLIATHAPHMPKT
eukprot:scaffold92006_cov36-Phaeocystis_antarctica.AAC.1